MFTLCQILYMRYLGYINEQNGQIPQPLKTLYTFFLSFIYSFFYPFILSI